VSQLIEELDSLGIIVLHDKPSKYVDKWVESSLSSADKKLMAYGYALRGFLSSISDGVCSYIFF
jgi:hypothetical protein